jgi:hypothetical protein
MEAYDTKSDDIGSLVKTRPSYAQPSITQSNFTLQQGDVFYVAFVSTHSIWVGGFSYTDRSGGSGLKYGQSPWESPVTYQGSEGQQGLTLPTNLPQAELTSSFETAIVGNVAIPIG